MKTKISINTQYRILNDFVKDLPSVFKNEGDIIHQGRNVLKVFHKDEYHLVVKNFKKPHLVNRIIYTFIRGSKAMRSYENAFKIQDRGFSTPEPIACVEQYEGGFLFRSFYVSEFDPASKGIVPYMYGEKEEPELLKALAQFIACLHEQNMMHLDLSPGNILYEKSGSSFKFFLVDINRFKFAPVSKDRAYRNLSRLCRSQSVSTYIAEQYAIYRNWDIAESIYKINLYSDAFFEKKTYNYARKDMKKAEGLFRSIVGPIQLYSIIKGLRQLTCGKLKIYLFDIENNLYYRYLKICDVRNIFEKRYGYHK